MTTKLESSFMSTTADFDNGLARSRARRTAHQRQVRIKPNIKRTAAEFAVGLGIALALGAVATKLGGHEHAPWDHPKKHLVASKPKE